MLATLVAEPFHRPGWVYEEKYDGYRILAFKQGAAVSLRSRNALEKAAMFPSIAAAVQKLEPATAVLDGEVVALDPRRVSRFTLLQRGADALVYAAFDCLYLNGRDLRSAPLATRRAALEQAIAGSAAIFAARRLGRDGFRAYERARRLGLEGIIGKDPEAPYSPGRSTHWLKVKVRQEEELVIGGYTPPTGARTHFGALLLGAYAGKELRFVGKVGTGFTAHTLRDLYRRFQPLVRATTPFTGPVPRGEVTWLAPKLVAQVAFQEWTRDQRLRQPAFLGLRDDKSPAECRLPEAS
jgi:bifunctional non-homologous end joining protein LigD